MTASRRLGLLLTAALMLVSAQTQAGDTWTGVAVGWTEEHYTGRIAVFTSRMAVSRSKVVTDRALRRCREAGRWNCSPIGAFRGRCFSISAGEWRRYEISGGGSELNLYGYGGGDTLEEGGRGGHAPLPKQRRADELPHPPHEPAQMLLIER